jgi:cell wall assembly regulator SMI1
MNEDQEAFWNRLDAMLARHAPEVFRWLRPPASVAQIEAVEHEMQLVFPPDLRAAYLRHDGSFETEAGVAGTQGPTSIFWWYSDWCSLEQGLGKWRSELETMIERRVLFPDEYPEADPSFEMEEIRCEGWNRARIPIGLSNTPLTVYVDLAPAKLGTVGQLITDDGSMQAHLQAPSLNQYLIALTNLIESGDVVHDARFGWIGGKKRFEIHSLWPEFKLTNYPVPL